MSFQNILVSITSIHHRHFITDCQGKPVDVGLILDNSGSVRPHQYVKMMQFVEDLVMALDVGRDKARVAVITYANDARIRLKLNELYDGKSDLRPYPTVNHMPDPGYRYTVSRLATHRPDQL